MAPPPLLNPTDTLRRRGDLVSTGRQPISLAPTAQWVTSGEDSAIVDNPDRKSGRVPSRKGVVDLLHRNGRAPTPRLPGERLGEYIRQRAFYVFNAGPNVDWKEARNRDFRRFDI